MSTAAPLKTDDKFDGYTDRLDITKDSWVNMQGSWGGTKPEKRSMRYTAWVRGTRGGFEIYDTEDSERYYAEGMLNFDPDGPHTLYDYDGVYSLPIEIIMWLDTLGRIPSDKLDYFREQINEHMGVGQ